MSKSTTRGRQRGRRRNRPLRCEASTRMREWMCYRNHLVRRRGSAHDTSGRCPFHITKFSPGRSCWARESYSCPEYLMEMPWQSSELCALDTLEWLLIQSIRKYGKSCSLEAKKRLIPLNLRHVRPAFSVTPARRPLLLADQNFEPAVQNFVPVH